MGQSQPDDFLGRCYFGRRKRFEIISRYMIGKIDRRSTRILLLWRAIRIRNSQHEANYIQPQSEFMIAIASQ